MPDGLVIDPKQNMGGSGDTEKKHGVLYIHVGTQNIQAGAYAYNKSNANFLPQIRFLVGGSKVIVEDTKPKSVDDVNLNGVAITEEVTISSIPDINLLGEVVVSLIKFAERMLSYKDSIIGKPSWVDNPDIPKG